MPKVNMMDLIESLQSARQPMTQEQKDEARERLAAVKRGMSLVVASLDWVPEDGDFTNTRAMEMVLTKAKDMLALLSKREIVDALVAAEFIDGYGTVLIPLLSTGLATKVREELRNNGG